MKKFRFEFEATMVAVCTVSVNAKNTKEAFKKFREFEQYDDWEEGEQISCEIDFNTATIEGEWIKDTEGEHFYRYQENIAEAEEEQAKYERKPIPKAKKIEYLDKLLEQTENLNNAFFIMNPLISASDLFGYDINDFIQRDYPFNLSDDELVIAVSKWINSVENNIAKELQRLDDCVEEPAPYYTKKEAKDKFVCAVKLTNKTDCVRYHLRADRKDGWPVLYDSIEEAEADHFFDPLTDKVVPAVEFKEDGISIVKNQ